MQGGLVTIKLSVCLSVRRLRLWPGLARTRNAWVQKYKKGKGTKCLEASFIRFSLSLVFIAFAIGG